MSEEYPNHARLVRDALAATQRALGSATVRGRRRDCLRVAEGALLGALRNVEWEDSIAPEVTP